LPAGSPSFGFLAFLIAVVVVAAGVGAGVLYAYNHPKAPSGPVTVAIGDNVTVSYIGLFGGGPQQGKVFDTSIQSVATNNASWPKSLEYTPRNASGYTPLPVHVGPTPSSGYNVSGVTYLGVVPGFWKALIGLGTNQTRWFTFPASEGYGPLDTSCLVSAPLVQRIPTVVTLTAKAFASSYAGITANAGVTFADPTYGWTDSVLSANATAVVVGRLPYVGESVDPYGWSILVTNVTSTTITLSSQLTPASVGNVAGTIPGSNICGQSKFIVWSVNPATGMYTQNYNREVVGQTLTFVVTIVTILPP
jgi:hypothetical protein